MLKVGIVGLGAIGEKYLNILAQFPQVEIKSLCVSSDKSVQKLKEKYGSQYFISKNYKKLAEDDSLEAIFVLTPHPTHYEICKEVLLAKKHLFCEKPLTLTGNEAEELVDLAKKNHCVFAVGYNLRFLPAFEKTAEILANNLLGTLTSSQWIVNTMYRDMTYYHSASWRGTLKGEGGGVLLNQGNHELDLYRHFFGEVIDVKANLRRKGLLPLEVEEAANILFRFKNGHQGLFHCSVTEKFGENHLEIFGTKGKLQVTPHQVILTTEDKVEKFTYPKGKEETYPKMLFDFIEACIHQGLPKVTGESGAKTVKLLERIYHIGDYFSF